MMKTNKERTSSLSSTSFLIEMEPRKTHNYTMWALLRDLYWLPTKHNAEGSKQEDQEMKHGSKLVNCW
jgi:hypothetical protein